MNDHPLDPRKEKLIALLYGELSGEEERELREALAADEELRIEWEELQATREILGEWDVTDRSPGFVFMDDPAAAGTDEESGFLGRLCSRLRGFPSVAAWAVAAAAVLIAVLSISGFRVETRDGTLVFRFGSHSRDVSPLADRIGREGGEVSVPLEAPPATQRPDVGMISADDPLLKPGLSPFVTREEFEAYAAGMTQTLVMLLNEYGVQRDLQVSALLKEAFGGVLDKQTRDYRDLRNRLEVMSLGLSEEQFKTNVQVDYLMHQYQPGLMAPTSQSPADGEGVEK